MSTMREMRQIRQAVCRFCNGEVVFSHFLIVSRGSCSSETLAPGYITLSRCDLLVYREVQLAARNAPIRSLGRTWSAGCGLIGADVQSDGRPLINEPRAGSQPP
jgi:hypothetical protein